MDNFKILKRKNKAKESQSKISCIEIGSSLYFQSTEQYDCRQIAIRQEHILGLIFSFVEIKSLKDMRHVCRRWKDPGAAAISKKIKTVLFVNSHLDARSAEKAEKILINCLTEVEITYAFIGVMKRIISKKLSVPLSLPHLMNLSSYFPCRNFYLEITHFTRPTTQNYLALIGPHLTTLVLLIWIRDYDTEETMDAETAIFMESIEKLLCEKAVHLEKFRISVCSASDSGYLISFNFQEALTKWDLNPEILFFKRKLFLHRLKSFFICDVFSGKAFRDILDSAINLKSLALVPKMRPVEYQFTNYLEYFMEKQNFNKVCIISHLHFHINNESIPGFEKFLNHKSVFERLRLKYLCLIDLKFSPTLPDFYQRVGRLIERFLVSSSNTLQSFSVVPLQHFGKIKIPKLSMLRSLSFNYRQSSIVFASELTKRVFPIGFCVTQSFPGLETVVLNFHDAHHEHEAFIKRLRESFDRPFYSVKKLEVRKGQRAESLRNRRLSESAQLLVPIFPNAVVSVCSASEHYFCNNDFLSY